MFKFALVKTEYNEGYWALLIEDLKDLFLYLEQQQPKMVKQYFKSKKKKKLGHCTSNIELAVESAFFVNNNNRKTMVDDLKHLSDVFSKPKINMVLEGKRLLVNSTGIGFCPFNEKYHTILKVIEKEDFNMPDYLMTKKDIHITKWPGGKHYYVKIGNHDLEGKFNTVEFAEEQAVKFLKKINKKFKENQNV